MHLKLIVAIISFGILSAVILGAYWVWENEISKEKSALVEMEQIDVPKPDPGLRYFTEANTLLERGEIKAGRDRLLELVRIYRDSKKFKESKRIIGEINLDEIFTGQNNTAKKEHIVQPGESLALIANNAGTTIDYIKQASGLIKSTLHPGDKLITYPLNFTVIVDVKNETTTLMKDDLFFKEYQVKDINLPKNLRLPYQTKLKNKTAWSEGKKISFTNKKFSHAEKWLQCTSKSIVVAPYRKRDYSSEAKKPKGIFLNDPDMEELYTLLPNSTPIKIIK